MTRPRRKKPIRVVWSVLSKRFYAVAQYRENRNGTITVTGEKWDVTDEIAAAIERHDIEFYRDDTMVTDIDVEVGS